MTDRGEAAYLQLKPRLDKLPADRIVQPRSDVRAAASFVLSDTVLRLRDRGLASRFALLPAKEFDHSALENLGRAAEAVLWTQARLAEFDASVSDARLPVALVDEATPLRTRMLDVCAYHFREDAPLRAQVDDIRSNQGYLDLAEDLRRLAGLYRAEHATLKQDVRFYRAADAADALRLSQRINSELHAQGSQEARDQAWRAWTLLTDFYAELQRGARFLLRDRADTTFPSLHTIGRTTSKHRNKTTPANPPPPSTP